MKDKINIRDIGYLKLLEKIIELLDDEIFENKLKLIDKYIEILRIVKEGENNE